MIFDSRRYLQQDLKYEKKMLVKYQNLVKGLPAGSLSVSDRGKHKYYTHVFQGKRQYLGKPTHPTVIRVQLRHYLIKSIQIIEDNIALIEKFIDEYKYFDPNKIIEDLPSAYNPLPETCYAAAGVVDIAKWASAPYIKNPKHPEHLVHQTSTGVYVRSKSELLIFEALLNAGLDFHYDEEVHINGQKFYCDFIIIVPGENRKVYWEHFGRMGSENYREECIWKFSHFVRSAMLPGRDFIFTFEDEDGNIDGRDIVRAIDELLCA
jgi:hypothetical protein